MLCFMLFYSLNIEKVVIVSNPQSENFMLSLALANNSHFSCKPEELKKYCLLYNAVNRNSKNAQMFSKIKQRNVYISTAKSVNAHVQIICRNMDHALLYHKKPTHVKHKNMCGNFQGFCSQASCLWRRNYGTICSKVTSLQQKNINRHPNPEELDHPTGASLNLDALIRMALIRACRPAHCKETAAAALTPSTNQTLIWLMWSINAGSSQEARVLFGLV